MATHFFIIAVVFAEIILAALLVAILVREVHANMSRAQKHRVQVALSPARQRAQMIARNWANLRANSHDTHM